MKLKILIAAWVTLGVLIFSGLAMLFMEYGSYTSLVNERENARIAAEKLAKEKADKEAFDKLVLQEALAENHLDYDVVNPYYNDRAAVKKDGKWGYIDLVDKQITGLIFDVAGDFTHKIAKVKRGKLWGYINTEGQAVIPIEYYYCGDISEGMIAVGKNGKYGFMDVTGREICPLIYDGVESFGANGNAKVILDGMYGYIDKTGKVVIEIEVPYKPVNSNFEGTWSRTDVHSGLQSTIRIYEQTKETFEFEINSNYYSDKGRFEGTAKLLGGAKASYDYISAKKTEKVSLSIVDDLLEVSSTGNGNLGMGSEISIVGSYTLESPKYTNEKVLSQAFDLNTGVMKRIKDTLGEKLYNDVFLYGLRNGLYEKKVFGEDSAIPGDLYKVWIPTMKHNYKLLVNDDYVYFYYKENNEYKTDDPDRINKIPSAIAFDEL